MHVALDRDPRQREVAGHIVGLPALVY